MRNDLLIVVSWFCFGLFLMVYLPVRVALLIVEAFSVWVGKKLDSALDFY